VGIETVPWIAIGWWVGRIHLSLGYSIVSDKKESEITKKKQQAAFILTNKGKIRCLLPMTYLIKR